MLAVANKRANELGINVLESIIRRRRFDKR